MFLSGPGPSEQLVIELQTYSLIDQFWHCRHEWYSKLTSIMLPSQTNAPDLHLCELAEVNPSYRPSLLLNQYVTNTNNAQRKKNFPSRRVMSNEWLGRALLLFPLPLLLSGG